MEVKSPKAGLTLIPATSTSAPLTPEKAQSTLNAAPLNASELIRMGIDPEAYCEICKKELCSKYFLKTHKHNIHGIVVSPMSTSPTALQQPPPPLASNAPSGSAAPVGASGGAISLNLCAPVITPSVTSESMRAAVVAATVSSLQTPLVSSGE